MSWQVRHTGQRLQSLGIATKVTWRTDVVCDTQPDPPVNFHLEVVFAHLDHLYEVCVFLDNFKHRLFVINQPNDDLAFHYDFAFAQIYAETDLLGGTN